MYVISGREGVDIVLFIIITHTCPQRYNNVFLYDGLATFGGFTLIKFWLVG